MDETESAENLMQAVRDKLSAEGLTQRFAGRAIVGDVVLDDLDYPHRFDLSGCTFRGRFSAVEARFGRSVYLNRCLFERGLILSGTVVEGNLEIRHTRLGMVTDFQFDGKPVAVRMEKARVGRSVDLGATTATGTLMLLEVHTGSQLLLGGTVSVNQGDLLLQGASIGTYLFCCSLSAAELRPEIDGQVKVRSARVGGSVDFSGAKIGGQLDFQNTEIGGNLFCRTHSASEPRPEVGGRVWLRGTRVGRQADFCGVSIGGDLDLQYADIGETLYCRSQSATAPRPEVGGKVRICSVRVGGQVDFCSIRIVGDLDAQGANIKGSFYCRSLDSCWPRPEVGGRVWLYGATISGQADFCGVQITGSLDLQNAVIGTTLLCRMQSSGAPWPVVGGQVNLVSATIRGGAFFTGADIGSLLTSGSIAFDAERAELGDGLYLGSRPGRVFGGRETAIYGHIHLSYLRVNAGLSLTGIAATGDVCLHAAHADGDLDARRHGGLPTRLGRIDASNLTVTGNVSFRGAELTCRPTVGPDGQPQPCLDLRFATIAGQCELPPGNRDTRRIHLDHADLGDVMFTGPEVPAVQLDGAKFRLLTVPDNDHPAFLNQTVPFLRSNYELVEDYLRERGDDETADRVYREMRRRDRRTWAVGRRPGWTERWVRRPAFVVFDLLDDWLTGYSTRSIRLGLALLVLFGVSLYMFRLDRSVKRAFTPTAVELRDHPELSELERHPGDVGKVWRAPDAVSMALRTVVPYIELAVDSDWQPSSNESVFALTEEGRWKDWTSFENVAGLIRLLCYVAIPLFLVSVTRLLKRRGE